jgi:capsular polysaccharide biosynthesis protein
MPPVPVLIDAGMPETHRQALELLLPKGINTITIPPLAIAHVRRLWCAPSLMYMPVHEKMNDRFKWDYLASPPARFAPVLAEMTDRIHQALSSHVASPERVFLARKPTRRRKLVNRDAIEMIAKARGFEIVYPEDLDFADQFNLLSNARYVMGPEGSAIFLAFFARPGSKLCILNHPYTLGLPVLTGLLREIGIDVTVLTGPYVQENEQYPHFADYQIKENQFLSFLDGWL